MGETFEGKVRVAILEALRRDFGDSDDWFEDSSLLRLSGGGGTDIKWGARFIRNDGSGKWLTVSFEDFEAKE